ncbi:MRPS34 [Mytilus coruscus]|uniref:MRPS34 n=1 Tax=Mytilus coruscus TaxID=42192 RepID=A0A6J8CBX8_MYTCO|nr:MRPS34 [Mytilus coruscus]
MPVRFVGKKSFFRGNTLFWLAANLRNNGVGRVVVRTREEREYPEKCYYVLTNVKPDFSEPNLLKGEVWGERIFRGKKCGIQKVEKPHQKDWKLIPKEEEAEFCQITDVFEETKYVPKLIPFPPLMGVILQARNNLPQKPLLKINLPEDAEGFEEDYVQDEGDNVIGIV